MPYASPTSDPGIAPANRRSWVLLKRCGLQVTEVRISSASDRQFRGAVTIETISIIFSHMLGMVTGIVAVVLTSPGSMAGGTLRVDIERTGCPGRRGLPTVTTGVGAGAAVEAWRATTLVIEAGQYTDLRAAIIMVCATVAGVTVRAS